MSWSAPFLLRRQRLAIQTLPDLCKRFAAANGKKWLMEGQNVTHFKRWLASEHQTIAEQVSTVPGQSRLFSCGSRPRADFNGREWQRCANFRRGYASEPAAGEGSAGQKALPESAGAAAGRRTVRSGPVTWGSLLLLLCTGGGLLYYYDSEKKRRLEVVRQGPPVGRAAIGGPFSLLDHTGKPTTDQDLKGSWNLLYFGFTYCPDICPEELQKLATAVDLVEKNGGLQVRPVFISIDPERDTVEQVRLYVQEFHPRLLGLTGSVEAVRTAAREYRVYYMKTEEEGDDYLVDHSIIMYLMDPNMDFVKFFGKNYTAEALAEGILEEVRNWSTSK